MAAALRAGDCHAYKLFSRRNSFWFRQTCPGDSFQGKTILMVPVLLICPCALIVTRQTPAAIVFGNLNLTCAKLKLGTRRTSSAGTSKLWLLASTRLTTIADAVSPWLSCRFSAKIITLVFRSGPSPSQFAIL